MPALLLLGSEPDADQSWRPQEHPHPVPSPLAGTRVLIAEDDATVRGMLERILAEEGYAVTVACHGEEALGYALTGRSDYDLVITDVRMPRMDGWELGRRLRRRWPDLPVLYISGWDSELARGPHLGTMGPRDGFLRKPFDPAQLVQHIERLLRRR
jgi:two-component system cell cycle sensor histidine kinase/response regulator CckA